MPDLFMQITSEDNIKLAYKDELRGASKYSPEALAFQRDEVVNLRALRRSVLDGTYRPNDYNVFWIFEPKQRLVHAPSFQDKIVQRSIQLVLNDFYIPRFISDSYACMPNRGAHKAADKVMQNLQKGRRLWGQDAFVLKLDVRNFFFSIDREILKSIYRTKIHDQRLLSLLDVIVDSSSIVGDRGLPLGNSTSQIFANLYLDQLDQTCKRYWGYRYYVRYMDDVIIVLQDKEGARIAQQRCVTLLRERLHLEANQKKTQIFPIAQGVNAYGLKIYATHKLLRDDSKRRIKRKTKAFPRLIEEGKLTIDKANMMLASWCGHAKHANSRQFVLSLLERRPYLDMTEEDILIIK